MPIWKHGFSKVGNFYDVIANMRLGKINVSLTSNGYTCYFVSVDWCDVIVCFADNHLICIQMS